MTFPLRTFAPRLLLGFLLLAALPAPAAVPAAEELTLAAQERDIQAVLDRLPPGATLRIPAGRHIVHLHIRKPVTLTGDAGAILDGEGHGDVIRISAPDVTIRGLTIVNSGRNLTHMNAGIFVERGAERVTIRDNRLDNNAFGIWLDACKGPRVIGNKVHGIPEIRSQDRGNGIHLYSVTEAEIRGNEIWETRDGIYIDTSQNNVLADNLLHDLRYGVHYMYSYSNKVIGNRTYNTRTGYALMQSKYLTVLDNESDRDSNYGMLMNYITYSTIAGNRVHDVQEGTGYVTGGDGVTGAEGKAIFIYNSQFNEIRDNLFADSDIGIHLTAGSEDNTVFGNSFLRNRVQVKYVATRDQDWSHEGRGNFWSDYLGWDLDADGIGDKQYEPNDAVDHLLWKYPIARILMSSPAIETLRWVQEQFPVLKPQGVRDSAPLMLPPEEHAS
ncbi:MAG: nitrous oxide reductase family maturation protein NosD [Gammaproteobacteria bacterium]|nr:nitrous oxide reductase family maturation protein NosD [Gammaproteobacteria bacterium]